MHPIITELIIKARQDDLARTYRRSRGEGSGRRHRLGRRTAERLH